MLEQKVAFPDASFSQEKENRSRLAKELERAQVQVAELEKELQLADASIESIEQSRTASEKELSTIRSFEPLLREAAEAKAAILLTMRSKLVPFQPEELTLGELSFALNQFGVMNVEFIARTLEEEVSMEYLDKVDEATLIAWGIRDLMQRQRILLSLHLLTNGLILDESHVEACGLCQNQTPEETVAFLQECEIKLPQQLVIELNANAGHLMLMNTSTIHQTFKVPFATAVSLYNRLQRAKEDHLQVISTL